MNIKRIEHIAINTSNIEASSKFYREILGFEQLETIENGDNTITYFLLPDGARLELFDYHGKSMAMERGDSDAGLKHIAFEVEDVNAHERELRARGVNITMSSRDLPHLGVKALLFTDPDGVILEFCEKTK
ncbi:MAG: VOC family protein [Clostridiaceae bacterium]|jgi:catechol 2,3-dioxygenase-like lactoylglutathione lyase family enzyme|nr:VOC family protein [Clostridiaceae bacterium]